MSQADRSKIRLHAVFRGAVQGVGFRYTAVWESRAFDVTGCVKNLPDGSVELVAEGRRDEVQKFLERIQTVFKRNVRGMSSDWEPPTGEFDGFAIGY